VIAAAPAPRPALAWRWLGRVRHADAVVEMEAIRERVLAGGPGELLLAEHEPVITLGRGGGAVLASPAALAARGIEVVRSSRGGAATYHGPGQLMIYPVVRVRGVVDHLARIAGALADLAAELGVEGAGFRREPAGLWRGDRKLAACGLHLRRGVAIHGFALDVATPAEAWRAIVPCGLADAPVASLADLAPGPVPSVAELAPRAAARLVAALGSDLE
jgi:lipoate-protein ligase B